MTAPPSEMGKQEIEVSLICGTCGMVYLPTAGRNPRESCGTLIRFLTCNAGGHPVVFSAGWQPGGTCPESKMSGCTGTLQDMGVTGPCPGRLQYNVN